MFIYFSFRMKKAARGTLVRGQQALMQKYQEQKQLYPESRARSTKGISADADHFDAIFGPPAVSISKRLCFNVSLTLLKVWVFFQRSNSRK